MDRCRSPTASSHHIVYRWESSTLEHGSSLFPPSLERITNLSVMRSSEIKLYNVPKNRQGGESIGCREMPSMDDTNRFQGLATEVSTSNARPRRHMTVR